MDREFERSSASDWLAQAMAIPGWTEPDELTWLHGQATRMASVLEIGCWLGRSTTALARGCPNGVTTVDTFQGTPSELETTHKEATIGDLFARAQNYLSFAAPDRVRFVPMASLQAVGELRQDFDMVFIDADHSAKAVLTDLMLWEPRCRSLLCGHDREHPGVARALQVFDAAHPAYRVKSGPGGLWFADRVRS